MKYVFITGDPIDVDLTRIKKYLRVSHDADDSLIKALYESAFMFCEEYTGLAFRAQQWQLQMSKDEATLGVYVARNPFTGVVGVTVKINNLTEAITPDQYHISVSDSSVLFFLTDPNIIADADAGFDAVKYGFTVGYQSVPNRILTAAQMLTAYYYENRGDTAADANNALPPEAIKILDQFRVLFL